MTTYIKPTFWILLVFICTSFTVFSQEIPDDDQSRKAMNIFLDAEKNKMLENYPEAIKLYEKTLQVDPNYDPAMFELGRLYVMQQKYEEALMWLEKAHQLDSQNKWYSLLLIDLYRNNYQISEAIDVYKILLDQEPNNTEFLLSVSGLYTIAEDYTQALSSLDRIEEIDGKSEKVSFQKRSLFLQQKEIDKAIEVMISLSEAFPEEEKYCSMIAEMYMQEQKHDEALVWYQKVLKINPNNPYIQITLADFYGKSGDTEKAWEYLKEGYLNPNLDIDTKVQVLVNYFDASAKNQETMIKSRAYELAEILVNTHPDNPKSHAIYGDLFYSDSLYLEASQQFMTVIELDSTRYPVWQQLLYSLSMLSDNKNMADYSFRAMEQFPELEFPYYVNAISNFQLGHIDQVINSIERGLYFASNEALIEQFHMFLGDAYHEKGESSKAYENYDKCLAINPENSFVLNNYAYYLSLENRELEKAAEMAKKAVELDPNENNTDTYGWVLYQLGQYDEALKYIEESVNMTKKPSAVVYEHLGDVYLKLSDIKKAKSYWKKAKKAGGDPLVLDEKIKQD